MRAHGVGKDHGLILDLGISNGISQFLLLPGPGRKRFFDVGKSVLGSLHG
jgi:hypothetical protein